MPDYGWLCDKDRAELERHVSECRSCEEKLKTMEILGDVIFEGGDMKSPDLSGKIMKEINTGGKKTYPVFSFVAAFIAIEAAIIIMMDPRFRGTVENILSAVGISEEYMDVIGEFFTSSLPFSYDLTLTGFLNIEMILILMVAGVALSFPAIRFLDERRSGK